VLLLSTVATIALILGGGFETLIAIASVLYVLVYMSGFVALLVLRRSKPSLPQPYKVWCYPWSTLLVLAGSAVFFVAAVVGDLKNSLFALILAVCTYPLYPLVVRNRARRVSLKVAELRDPAV
jgi:basic amino acid/polyamine antiporter, APA family